MNKLVIPARLEKAAKELKDNMTILMGCSPEVKEVIVNRGELGGLIEKEENLSHYGNAWVSGDAQVYGDAKVSGKPIEVKGGEE